MKQVIEAELNQAIAEEEWYGGIDRAIRVRELREKLNALTTNNPQQ